jgi:nucleoside-diphosphate-sugar epimerase
MSSKKILVGDGGFIGKNRVHVLQKRGYDVLAIDLCNTEWDTNFRDDIWNFSHIKRIFKQNPFRNVLHFRARRLLFAERIIISTFLELLTLRNFLGDTT